MATSKAKQTDSIEVEVNGEPAVKGPDPDRLADHKAEAKAFAARVKREAKG